MPRYIQLTPSALDCDSLPPAEWALPIPGVPLPPPAPDLPTELRNAWMFGNGQTGQLEKANQRAKDRAEIVANCKAQQAAAAKAATKRKFL